MNRINLLLVICLCVTFFSTSAQPSPPAECLPNTGNGKKDRDSENRILGTSSGVNTFLINSLPLFEGPATSEVDNFSASISSSGSKYKLYVAGKIDYMGTGATTNIPLETFTITARRSGGISPGLAITPVALTGTYQQIVQTTGETGNNIADDYQFTLDRAKLDTFKQLPGDYQLTIYLCYCWY